MDPLQELFGRGVNRILKVRKKKKTQEGFEKQPRALIENFSEITSEEGNYDCTVTKAADD